MPRPELASAESRGRGWLRFALDACIGYLVWKHFDKWHVPITSSKHRLTPRHCTVDIGASADRQAIRLSMACIMKVFAAFPCIFVLGCGNEALVSGAERKIRSITAPGTSLEDVQSHLNKSGLRFSLTPRDKCLRQRWGGSNEKPEWWPEKHWWYDEPIKSVFGGPPCTDGPYLHTRIEMKTLNPLITSGVHVYFRFDKDNKLIDHRAYASHTGL